MAFLPFKHSRQETCFQRTSNQGTRTSLRLSNVRSGRPTASYQRWMRCDRDGRSADQRSTRRLGHFGADEIDEGVVVPARTALDLIALGPGASAVDERHDADAQHA